MGKIKITSEEPKNYSSSYSSETDEKGTKNNPYTLPEFMDLLESGEWTGGFVAGAGYIAAEFSVEGYSYHANTYQIYAINYGLFQNVGLRKTCYACINSVLDNHMLSITGVMLQIDQLYRFQAYAFISIDGKEIERRIFNVNEPIVYPSHMCPLGALDIDMNRYHGQVQVNVSVYYETGSSDLGYNNGSFTRNVYNRYRE